MQLAEAARCEAQPARRTRPPPPLILSRTTTSVDVAPRPAQLRGAAAAAYFAAYCKPFGAGVEMRINPTVMQYAGTGVLTPLGGRVTIENLQPNETYVFAVALYDADRQIIGGLGTLPQITPHVPGRWQGSRTACAHCGAPESLPRPCPASLPLIATGQPHRHRFRVPVWLFAKYIVYSDTWGFQSCAARCSKLLRSQLWHVRRQRSPQPVHAGHPLAS